MFNQHAKWLKVTREIPWRRPIASLNYLLSSHTWRQDHNGFSHQDPGFIDHVVNKKAEIIRVYLPPDANCLLSVADHCLRSRDYINVIVAGKQPALQYLTMDEAILHCTRGVGHLGLGEHGRGRRARRRARLRRRRADARDAVRRRADPRAPARAEGARRQRRRPHAAAARERAPARPVRGGVRRPLHDGPAGDLRLPRLPVADPPADLPAQGPRQPPRARLHRGGHDHDAVRHGHAQQHGPLPPGDRRDRPPAGAGGVVRRTCASGCRTSGCATAPTRARSATTCRTRATGRGRAAAAGRRGRTSCAARRPDARRARPRRQRGLEQPEGQAARRRGRPARPSSTCRRPSRAATNAELVRALARRGRTSTPSATASCTAASASARPWSSTTA